MTTHTHLNSPDMNRRGFHSRICSDVPYVPQYRILASFGGHTRNDADRRRLVVWYHEKSAAQSRFHVVIADIIRASRDEHQTLNAHMLSGITNALYNFRVVEPNRLRNRRTSACNDECSVLSYGNRISEFRILFSEKHRKFLLARTKRLRDCKITRDPRTLRRTRKETPN